MNIALEPCDCATAAGSSNLAAEFFCIRLATETACPQAVECFAIHNGILNIRLFIAKQTWHGAGDFAPLAFGI